MSNERINELINNNAQANAPLDFADLLRRIEKDNGASTAPQMTVQKSNAARVVGTAAAVTATVALGAMALVGIGSSMKSYEAAAPEAPMCDSAAPEADWYASEGPAWDDNEFFEDNFSVSTEEPGTAEPEVSDSDVSDSDVSDSDVSDSDVSGSDAGED